MTTYKIFEPACAAGATGATNSLMYVGPHTKAILVVSNVTGFNSGAGNATIQVRQAIDENGGTSVMTSIATETVAGVYELTNIGLQYMKIGFGTAPTASATGRINIVVYDDL
jgi:hypothetical protein